VVAVDAVEAPVDAVVDVVVPPRDARLVDRAALPHDVDGQRVPRT